MLAAAAVLLGMCIAAEAVVNIQNVGAGARSAALGNSFVAVADDADAVFFNPAGVSRLGAREVAYTNVSLFFGGIEGDDLGQHVVSYVQPLGSRLGVGVGYERIGSDLMSENGALLSVGYAVSRSLSLGVNAKYLFWSVGDIPNDPVTGAADPLSNESAGAVGVDVGVLWETPVPGAQVGVLVKNVNEPNVAKESVPGDSDAGALPMDVAVGVSYRLAGLSLVTVEWQGRDVTGDEMDSRLVVGGETQLVEGLLVRAGGSKLFQEDATGDLNAGLGYSWNAVQFDYGYHIPLDLTETDGAHRFSFAYRF
jgi:hypothetical protein